MTEQPGPPTLSAHALGTATLIALVVAGLALVVYILPASYGLDPVGAGEALGVEGQAPDSGGAPTTGAAGGSDDGAANRTLSVNETPLTRYEASWPTTVQTGSQLAGYTPENETTTVDLDLPRANLTQVTVNLTWEDDNETADQETAPDELELVLEAPDGTRSEPVAASNPPGGEVSVEASLTVQPPPAGGTVHATDRGQARARATASAIDASPVGAWKAHVTVREAGNAQAGALTAPDSGGPGQDQGTRWTLTPNATTYQLEIDETGPSPVRQETRTFQLAEGDGFEHKVTLSEGSQLTYEWNATGQLFYDFHGEPQGDPADFESYGKGTTEAASGNFTAPFEGTHGWYWENRAGEPVEITLTTRGDYEDGFTT